VYIHIKSSHKLLTCRTSDAFDIIYRSLNHILVHMFRDVLFLPYFCIEILFFFYIKNRFKLLACRTSGAFAILQLVVLYSV